MSFCSRSACRDDSDVARGGCTSCRRRCLAALGECAVTARDLSGPAGAKPGAGSPRRRNVGAGVGRCRRQPGQVRPAGGRPHRARPFLRQRPGPEARCLPPPGRKQAPILVMVHGGAWKLGDKGNTGVVANKVLHWLPRGYIVVSLNYRLSRPPSPLEQAEDVGTRARLRPGACCRLGRRRIASRPHGPFVGRAPRGPLDRRTGHCRSRWRPTVAWLGR